MKRMKQFLTLVAVCIFSLSAWAQETVAVNTGDLISPEVKNQTVTFRLLAPEAREVWVETDFFEKSRQQTPLGEVEMAGRQRMEKERMVCGAIRLLCLRPNCILIAFMWMVCVCLTPPMYICFVI